MADSDKYGDQYANQYDGQYDGVYDDQYDDAYDYDQPLDGPTRSLDNLPSFDIEEEESSFLSQDCNEFDMEKTSTREEVTQSFGALKASISQGRELKAREKELDVLMEQLHAERQELADRDNILANYAMLASEQQAIIDQNVAVRSERKAQLAQESARVEELSASLARMKEFHAAQIQPLSETLGRARAAADQAKNDERSRKSELSAAESELRKADDQSVEIAAAQQRVASMAYEDARARSDSAKARLQDAEKAYEVARKQYDGEEAPLQKNIDELTESIESLKSEIADLEATIDAAHDRKLYIEDVYGNPAETEKLRDDVMAIEADKARMDEENEELRYQLEESKDKAKKAKLLMAGIGALVLIIIIVAIVLALN